MAIQVTCSSCQTVLKTPETSAGKKAKCPKCGGIVLIPELSPPSTNEEEYVLEAEVNPLAGYSDADLPVGAPAGGDRKPCPACGEMIIREAVKCRYCGEVFDPILRKEQYRSNRSQSTAPEDDDLGLAEWLLAIFAGGIGCLVGIIWMIQGKPKGTKMLLVSLALPLVIFFVFFLIGLVGALVNS